jgi:hypothetical protein
MLPCACYAGLSVHLGTPPWRVVRVAGLSPFFNDAAGKARCMWFSGPQTDKAREVVTQFVARQLKA